MRMPSKVLATMLSACLLVGFVPGAALAEELPPPAADPTGAPAPPPAPVAPAPDPDPGYSPYLPPGSPRPRFVKPSKPLPPTSGDVELIAAGLSFAIGAPLTIGSVFFVRWACEGQSASCWADARVLSLVGFGAAFSLAGFVLLGIGGVKETRYKKWRRGQRLALIETPPHLGQDAPR